jgi:hypothetical protein
MQSFFEWLESFQFSTWVDNEGYFVSAVNVVHLLALTLFVGAVLIVDLRLLGRGMKKQPLAQVAHDAQPWLIAGFLALLLTGVLQIMHTPMKAYYSPNFWLKMQLLIVAVIFTFTLRRMATQAGETRLASIWGKVAGITSIALWAFIAVQGRLIGLLQ